VGGLHHEMGLAIVFDHLAFADVVGGGHVDVCVEGFEL
jgi:hypothetical protein